MISLPDAFANAMQSQLSEEWQDFREALSTPAPVSIRMHKIKTIHREEAFEKVKWIDNGVYLPERPVFTLDPAFHAGAYYVQEASSMLVGAAIAQLFPDTARLKVLDLAAAPGGKSTLAVEQLSPDSLLVCNEVIRSRFNILTHNIVKWGYPNTLVVNHDSQDFAALSNWFDLVMLDAPCSGEGLFRKTPDAMAEWSPENVRHCAARQKRILSDAALALKPGGILLYSTCTYNTMENDENVLWLCREYDFSLIKIDFPESWGISRTATGVQCYPHKVRGEGFFLAALQKVGEKAAKPRQLKGLFPNWEPLPAKFHPLVYPLLKSPEEFDFFIDPALNVRAIPAAVTTAAAESASALKRGHWGLEIGQLKGKDLVPAPALALSIAMHPEAPGANLDRPTALRFLKKEAVDLPGAPNGWALARYEGLNLGWAKVIPGRTNNYFPREWRILMEIA